MQTSARVTSNESHRKFKLVEFNPHTQAGREIPRRMARRRVSDWKQAVYESAFGSRPNQSVSVLYP